MAGQVLYDKLNNRLIYLSMKASPEYWDKIWEEENLKEKIKNSRSKIVSSFTKKYLLKGTERILEGGCGQAGKVYELSSLGYKVTGVDFAERTVKNINLLFPELDVRVGNVFKLPFDSNEFDGYWSIGVIEHFWDGYDGILEEAHRVLKKNGILFLTFPQMSVIRKIKGRLNMYAQYNGGHDKSPQQFYQFALDKLGVVKKLHEYDFDIVEYKTVAGLKGLKDEVKFIHKFLAYSSKRSDKLLFKVINKTVDILCSPAFGHSCIIIAKKI